MSRPPFTPTKAQRVDVQIWTAGGMSQDAIASAIGISRNTLRAHFADELAGGAARRRATVLVQMYVAAIEGNVAAQKAFLAGGAAKPAPIAKRRREYAIGRRAVELQEALDAGKDTDWGDDLAPLPDTPGKPH